MNAIIKTAKTVESMIFPFGLMKKDRQREPPSILQITNWF